MRETPRQDYYPGCKVTLIVRFEDFGAADAPKPPDKPPQLRSGKTDKAPLQATLEDGKFVLTQGGAKPLPGGPQGQTSSDDGRTFRVEGLIPRSANVTRNGVRTADTASLELAFDDFPFDPRVVRALGVQIYLGTLSPEEFDAGVRGVRRGDRGPGADNAAQLLSVIPDTFLDEQGNQRSNLRFSGFADEYRSSFSRDGAPVVNVEATDNTRLLIGQDAPPKLAISPDKPIDEAVAGYLANFPQLLGMSVEFRPAGDAPTLKKVLAKGTYRPDIGPPPAGGSGSKLSVWDYVTDACGSLGLLVRVEDTTIVIQRPRTLYATTGATRPDDPFQGRVLPGGRRLFARTLVLGRNLLDCEFGRNFTRNVPQNVEVRCFSPKTAKTLIARYPQKGSRVSQPLPGNASEQKWLVHEVSGISDEPTLRAIAQGIYESQGRQELTANVTTRALASYGGGNLDPDLLDVLAGDGLEIEIARETEGLNSTGIVEESLVSRAQAFLQERGYDAEISKAYAAAMQDAAFQRSFRCRNVKLSYTATEGITWDAELGNYLVVRADKLLPEGEETEVDSPTGGDPVKVKVTDA